MDQLTPDFYHENQWTPYPFIGPLDAFTKCFVDASVSVPPGSQGDLITLTSFDPLGKIEVKAGATTIVALTDPVAVSSFGAYAIWEVNKPGCQITLVFLGGVTPPAKPTCNYEFVPNVITYGPQGIVLSVASGSQEVAGPGDDLKLLNGANVTLEYTTDAAGNPTVVIGAYFDSTQPCEESSVTPARAIKSINGVPPNAAGGFTFVGKGIWMVEKASGIGALRVTNTGVACCDCPDYVDFFELIRSTTTGLQPAYETTIKVQDAYLQLMAYVRFMLQAPTIGEVLPGEDDRLAT